MDEYIKKETALQILERHMTNEAAVIEHVFHTELYLLAKDHAKDYIAEIPAADVQEVRHGFWKTEDSDSGDPGYYEAYLEVSCSECGLLDGVEQGQYDWYYGDPFPWMFCPKCGAKMDGKGDRDG